MTTPPRQRELASVIETALVEFDKKAHAMIHTYPYRSVAGAMSRVLIGLEKGQPRLISCDGRVEKLAKAISAEHKDFDRANGWRDGYSFHDAAGRAIADFILRSEIAR